MLRIESLSATANDVTHSQARALFALYGHFLYRTQACGDFHLARYTQETDTLPADYTSANGEVLLALTDDTPAACIAFRAALRAGPATDTATGTGTGTATAEIKRLFVHPDFRNRGLARALVAEALTRIAARNFTRVILDTDPANMPGALELYHSFGFTPYRSDRLAYLEKRLIADLPHS